MTKTEAKNAILDTVNYYKDVARSKGYWFPEKTKIRFDLRGVTADKPEEMVAG